MLSNTYMLPERRGSRDKDEKSGIKCVVWDLDGTLWQGTLLDGDELVLTPGVKGAIQELDNRGILQSIASKNDYDAAWEKVVAFGLDEYFLCPKISWANKSDSIKSIADRLGIALDTFAFVDDQAFERDEVQYFLPEVTAIDAADINKMLDMPGMQPRFVTNESKIRRKMYQADMRRKQFEDEFPGSSEEFLKSLSMCMTIRAASELDLRRVEELTIRTHQLNTTGRSYSYEVLNGLLDSPDHLLLVAELEDRYGTNGTIGLALIEQESDNWLVKLLIVSCRVMTRGVGDVLISYILQSAKRRGVRLRAEFVANEHNRMMYVTYKLHGFYEVVTQDSFVLLEHALDTIRPFPRHVTVRSPGDEQAFDTY
jgi:FkbH-like protein